MKIKLTKRVQDTQRNNEILEAGTTIERDEKRGKDFLPHGVLVEEEKKTKPKKKDKK